MNYTKTTLDNTDYFETTNARGNITTVWEMCGTLFVQTNRSPARAFQDIAKPSKDAVALIAVMEA